MKKKNKKLFAMDIMVSLLLFIAVVLIIRVIPRLFSQTTTDISYDVDKIEREAIEYNDLLTIDCSNVDMAVAGSTIYCNIKPNYELENNPIEKDILKYLSIDYSISNLLKIESITLLPKTTRSYEYFKLDTSKKGRIVLKNEYKKPKQEPCTINKKECNIYGRKAHKLEGEEKETYDDSIMNVKIEFKLKISEKATSDDKLNINLKDIYIYTDKNAKNEEKNDNYCKQNSINYNFKIKEKVNKNNTGIYKVKVTNKNGANVYSSYNSTYAKIVKKIDYNTEIDIIGDSIDYYKYDTKIQNTKDFNLEDYKDNYYYVLSINDTYGYLKYSDVELIKDSINYNYKNGSELYYLYSEEAIYSGPGLSFSKLNITIPRGEFIEGEQVTSFGSGNWIQVTYKGQIGYLLEARFNSVNYQYNNILYGGTAPIARRKGTINTENNIINLYKYAFDNNEILDRIPINTELTFGSAISEPGMLYIYVEYNNQRGWIGVIDIANCKEKQENGNLYIINNDEKQVCN